MNKDQKFIAKLVILHAVIINDKSRLEKKWATHLVNNARLIWEEFLKIK